jgi:hypothetical protein
MRTQKNSTVAPWLVAAGLMSAAALLGACGPSGGGSDAAVSPDAAAVDCSGGDAAMGRMAVTMRGCASCHSTDFGGAVSGTPGPNLTPSELGGWTDAQITRAFLDGVDDENETLCTSMPRYRALGMTSQEACNIVAHLRSLSPIDRDVADTCM